jgi:hypothetical protein
MVHQEHGKCPTSPINQLHEMYIQQLPEFPTDFLHNPDMTKAQYFGKMNTGIITFSYPRYNGMKTYPFAFIHNGFPYFSSDTLTSKFPFYVEGNLSCPAVARAIRPLTEGSPCNDGPFGFSN